MYQSSGIKQWHLLSLWWFCTTEIHKTFSQHFLLTSSYKRFGTVQKSNATTSCVLSFLSAKKAMFETCILCAETNEKSIFLWQRLKTTGIKSVLRRKESFISYVRRGWLAEQTAMCTNTATQTAWRALLTTITYRHAHCAKSQQLDLSHSTQRFHYSFVTVKNYLEDSPLMKRLKCKMITLSKKIQDVIKKKQFVTSRDQ